MESIRSESGLVPLQPKERQLWLRSGPLWTAAGKKSSKKLTAFFLRSHDVEPLGPPETKAHPSPHPKGINTKNAEFLHLGRVKKKGSGKAKASGASPERSRQQLRLRSGWRLAESLRSTDPGWAPAAGTESSGTAAAGGTRWDERRQLRPATWNQ